MARFSQGLFRGLSSPSYAPGLMTVGAQLGSAQATAQAAERQKEIDSMSFKLLRQGLFSADQGDVSALAARTNDLVDMMGRTTDEKSRATLQDMITQLDAQRGATQTKATSNTAGSIIKTEQALMDLQKEMDSTAGPLAPERQKVFDALTQRLEFMKSSNAQAAIQADDIKLATKIKQFENKNKLFDAQTATVSRELSSVAYGSKQYDELAKDARSKGFGGAVDAYEKIQMDAEKTRLELDALRNSNAPLNDSQADELKALGIDISDPALAKTVYINLKTKEGEARINAALQQLTVPKPNRAKSIALGVLSEYQERGNIAPLWFDDLAEKIDELPEEKLNELLGLVQGVPEGGIREEVISFLRKEFKSEFADLEAEENKVEIGMAEEADAIDASIALTNAENKKMPGDPGYEDPNDPDVRRAAYEEIVQAAAQQRALDQAQGVGGRVL
jgi:hypothetical protein